MEVPGHIEEPSDSRCCVDEKSPDFYAGSFELSLENIVHETRCHTNIVEKIADADLNDVWDDEVVTLGHRLQQPAIKLPVEFKYFGIKRFPRVILLDRFFARLGKRIKRLFRRAFGGRCS